MTRCFRVGTLARLFVPLFAATLAFSVVARDAISAAAATSAPDYSGVRYGPMQKLRCPDGEYRGPEPGKQVWIKDDFTWAVTREFARRFCMPESMVSDDLVGAEAVAYRIKPSDEATCRLEGGQEVCRRKAELELELYLRSDLGLPRSHPEVRFYQVPRSERSSGLYIETNQALRNGDRRRAGVWTDPPGRVAPFHVFAGGPESRRVKFMYVNFGHPDLAIPGEDFYEQYYQADWIDGIDLIRLGPGPALGVGILSHSDTKLVSRRFGIGIIRQRDLPGDRGGLLTMTRNRFVHVVDLPLRVSELIYAYDKQQGDLLINAAKRSLGVPGVPPKPKDAEPLIPPATR